MSDENVLSGCLVESDPATIARARQAKRHALLVAILLQVLLVGLLVLAPLLGAVEKLPQTVRIFTPTPPYRGVPRPSETTRNPRPPAGRAPLLRNEQPIYQPRSIPADVADIKDPPDVIAASAEPVGRNSILGDPNGTIDLDAPGERRGAVPKAPETPAKPKGPVHVSEPVQLARLVRRVEPVYPRMLITNRIEGKVELRAVIAKDGTIQSLEVLSGNPLFVRAAREAIEQWRYQPTMLNGEPVEVETIITVVFTLRR